MNKGFKGGSAPKRENKPYTGYMKAQNPFSFIASAKAPEAAKAALLARVSALARRAYYARVSSFAAIAVASVTAFAASCAYAWQSVVSSGFGQYASLVFSDGGAAFSKELGLALIESLPALGLALVIGTAAAALWSISKLAARSKAEGIVSFA